MCAKHSLQENNRNTVIIWFAAMFLGFTLGFINLPFLQEFFNLIAKIFTRLFQFIAIPVIAIAVIGTLADLADKKGTSKIFSRTIFYTLSTTFAAAIVALLLFIIISPSAISGVNANISDIPVSTEKLSYSEHFISIIPNNILQPFLSGNVLSVLLVAFAIGLSLAFMPKSDNREVLIKAVRGMQELLFTLIKGLIFILPVGVLAFSAQLVVELKQGAAVEGLAQYTAVVITSNLLQFFVVLPLFLLAKKINPLTVIKAMSPALAFAFFSKSSAATLPLTLSSAENNLKLNPRIARFVLPICTTINMNGCAAFILITSLFLMKNSGIELSIGTMIIWAFIAVIAAVGNAGVPMGCYFLTLSLMSSMNVNIEIMAIILPIYAVIDMIETGVNVWSDSVVATITNKDLANKLDVSEIQEPQAA
ncbi:MAG: dicarboxylate/amino acid:cation symporter [Cardiobacteriaceae bacterium]|nr:dicarboxylate/amino acid:cation symporter [Cardiobacteriaceae bacterium]